MDSNHLNPLKLKFFFCCVFFLMRTLLCTTHIIHKIMAHMHANAMSAATESEANKLAHGGLVETN